MPALNTRAAATAAEVAVRRLADPRARRPRRQLPRQHFPLGVARDYGRALAALFRRSLAGLALLRERMPDILRAVRRARRDAFHMPQCETRSDAGEPEAATAILRTLEAAAREATRPEAAIAVAKEFATKTSTAQRIQLTKQVRAALGVELFAPETGVADLVDAWALENAALIRSVSQRVVDQVATATTRALAAGTLWPDLAAEIDKSVGLGEKRAKLIARDQVGKLYGQVNAQRQRNLGVTHFIWRTAADRRVRPEHRALEGEKFPFADGAPGEGLPGQPVLCRCYSEPSFDEILEGL